MTARRSRVTAAAGLVLAVLAVGPARAGDVVSVDPPNATTSAPRDTAVTVTFDAAVDATTIGPSTFRVFGRWSGPAAGVYTVAPNGLSASFQRNAPFSAGEVVYVLVSHDVRDTTGAPLRPAGYATRFWTATEPTLGEFEEIERQSLRLVPTSPVRVYGGSACDLDGDRFLDLLIVNEDAAEVVTIRNKADGTGEFLPFEQPPAAVEAGASPNEPGDFDGDGNVDLAVANSADDSISVLFGDGAGGWAETVTISGTVDPHGLTLVDADGDGDREIVVTDHTNGKLSLVTNLGGRTFAAPVVFEAGGSGEWSVEAADMDNDGIFDLAVSFRDGQQVGILLGRGDGTFATSTPSAGGGVLWMIGTGDVNGDGFEDVAVSSTAPGGGAILIGRGDGTLRDPEFYDAGGHTPATDFGDLDGDGDLDWVLSSFSGGTWRVLANAGDGVFDHAGTIAALKNPACAIMADIDRDEDLDLVLLDEIEDEIIFLRNTGAPPVTPPPIAGFLLPAKVDVTLPVPAKRRRVSGLRAKGDVDGGAGDFDPSAPISVRFGGREFAFPAPRERGRRLVFESSDGRLTLTRGKDGGSHAAFDLRIEADLTDQVAIDGPISLEFVIGDVTAAATFLLEGDLRYRAKTAGASLTEPAVGVDSLRATIRGEGADDLRVEIRFATDGAVPDATEPIGLYVGRLFQPYVSRRDFVVNATGQALARRVRGFRRLDVDRVRGRVVARAKGVDLSDLATGDVTLVVIIGQEARAVDITPGRRGRRVRY